MFLIFVLLLALCATLARAGSEAGDRAALCDFYASVPAASRPKLTGWCSTAGPCSVAAPWYGVSCTNGRVDVVAVDGLSGGKIPASFGNLDQVIMFSLAWNDLTGTIPSSLGLLTKMESLWLNSNKFTGPIPSSLCAYSKTAAIDFYENPGLTCYPSCLSSRSEFMSHGKGSVKTVCPANGGADLPPVVVDDCSNAPNPDLICTSGTRKACSAGKWICHGTPTTPTAPVAPATTTSSKPKCPDSKWKAVTGSGPFRCTAPRGTKSCPSGWKKTASASSTKGVTCSKNAAPTRAPTPAPEITDYAGSYASSTTYGA
jgi:hypothetical protein